MTNRRVVFSIVGWMKDYKGPTPSDPAPEGGGKYVNKNVGSEAWNFLKVKGKCYAFVTSQSKNGGLNLKRVNPEESGDSIDCVLLVFLSRVPNASKHPSRRDLPQKIGNGVRVVGWYSGCTLLSSGQKGGEERKNCKYNAVCLEAAEAVCVPELDRKDIGLGGLAIYGPGGFKQTRVRYPFTGQSHYDGYFSDPSSWVAKVLKYIDTSKVPSIQQSEASFFPDELKEPDKYPEGAKTTIIVNAYERDPRARKKCIEKYGCKCRACGFDFFSVYGELGRGFIHVHHLDPFSKGKGERLVDPVKDLRPVCPNCHAMLHRGSDIFTISELRDLLHSRQKKLASNTNP